MNLPFPYLDRITESTYQRTVLRMMDSNYFQFAHPLFNQFLTVLSLQQKMLKVIFAVKVIPVIQVVTIFNNISTRFSKITSRTSSQVRKTLSLSKKSILNLVPDYLKNISLDGLIIFVVEGCAFARQKM